MNIRHAVMDSPLGELTLVADGDALTGVYFRHHWRRPSQEALGRLVDVDTDDLLALARGQLLDYLEGRRTDFDLPNRPVGDDRQLRIWSMLSTIPFGCTTTYGDIAASLADGTTAWTVGQVVGRNPLSIIVPCHRVVGRDGKLTGYAGGVRRKQFLLELEEPADVTLARLF